jgi:hypothetical protein
MGVSEPAGTLVKNIYFLPFTQNLGAPVEWA